MFLTIELCTHAKLIICTKMDLALNQKLICHKIKQKLISWYAIKSKQPPIENSKLTKDGGTLNEAF